MLKHWKSRVSTLTLICRNGFLRIKVRVKNLRPVGHPGQARLFFWKAGFPQSGPAVSEKAWVSPAVPKVGRTGRLRTLHQPQSASYGLPNTALSCAKSGHDGVVKILLGREDVSPGRLDMLGRTALCYAAESGREVVEIRLARSDVNPNTLDSDGRTSLFLTDGNGHEGVVGVLLGRDAVNAEKPDTFGRTPLCRASENGHEGTVKILLGRGDVNPDTLEMFCQTPLSLTAWSGHVVMVGVLLGRGDVAPTDQMRRVECRFGVQLGVATREWWRYCSDMATSTLTTQICLAKHPSTVLPRMGARE